MKKFIFKDVEKYIDDLNDGKILYDELPHEFKLQKNDIKIPVKPNEPEIEDCCGTGCRPCVFDIYENKLEKYEKEIEKIVEILNRDVNSPQCQNSLQNI
jgi:hypothetical protein